MGEPVRLQFQETPWDLFVALIGASATAAYLIFTIPASASILALLFASGYVVVAALFPRTNSIAWIERVALSLGLGLALTTVLALAFRQSQPDVQLRGVVLSMMVFTTAIALVAYWRRVRLPIVDRLSLTLVLARLDWSNTGFLYKSLTTGLAAAVVFALGVLGYVLLRAPSPSAFTEFYVLGPGGNASDYPVRLNASQTGMVVLGIVDHGYRSMAYTIRVDLVGLTLAYNVTTQRNQTVDTNRTTLSWINATLEDGQNWTTPYSFRIAQTALWRVEFLLFENHDLASVSRALHLYVRIT